MLRTRYVSEIPKPQGSQQIMTHLFIWLSLYSSLSNKESVTGEFVVFSLRTLAVVTFVTPRLTQILLQLLVLEQRAQLGRFVTTLLFLLFCCVSHALSSFGCHGRNFPNRDNGEFKLIHKNNSLCWRRGKCLLSQTDDVSMPQSHFSPRVDWQAEKFHYIGSY